MTRAPNARGLRVGLIGPGRVGKVHAAAIRLCGQELAGVLAGSPATTAAAAARLNTRGFPSIQAMRWAVDIVHVATPDPLHFDQAMEFVTLGFPVIVESPLALTVEGSGRLVSGAERGHTVNATVLQRRYWGGIALMRAALQHGEVGRVRDVQCRYIVGDGAGTGNPNWRDEAHGGAFGPLAVLGSRVLDLVEYVTGLRVESVAAHIAPVAEPYDGRTDLVSLSFTLEQAPGQRAEGNVTISEMDRGHDVVELTCQTSTHHIAWSEDRPLHYTLVERGESTALPQNRAPVNRALPFAAQFREVYRAVRETYPPSAPEYPSFRTGHRLARFARALEGSYSTRRVVPLGDL